MCVCARRSSERRNGCKPTERTNEGEVHWRSRRQRRRVRCLGSCECHHHQRLFPGPDPLPRVRQTICTRAPLIDKSCFVQRCLQATRSGCLSDCAGAHLMCSSVCVWFFLLASHWNEQLPSPTTECEERARRARSVRATCSICKSY